MRRIRARTFFTLLALLSTSAFAQKDSRAQTLLDESGAPVATDAAPPAMEILDDSIEPQITIRSRDGVTYEEFRVGGRLYKIRVTPKVGPPYTLIDQKGDGVFSPADALGSTGTSVPMWLIGTF